MARIQLQGKIFLTGDIKVVTGLHIGRNSEDLDIGGVDNPVIRDVITKEPYIPGSSLRGKMRGLLDRHFNLHLRSMGGIQIHGCQRPEHYKKCNVCQVFGVAPIGDLRRETMPTRLIVRDTFLTENSRQELKQAETDGLFTEVKWEVTIDRITAAANPRPNERVPAGATFGPFQLIYGIYTQNTPNQTQIEKELQRFNTVLIGMELLKDDYLGGSGGRGSGQIAFQDLKMTFKPRTHYEKVDGQPIPIVEPKESVDALRKTDYEQKVKKHILKTFQDK